MKKIGLIVVVLIVLLVIVKISVKNSNGNDAGPIRIGAIISQTGVAQAFGEMSKYGIDLAVKEINAAGGINGRPVEVVVGDDQTDPKTAVGLYQKLTGIDKVEAIIGSNFDFVTQPLFALASTSSGMVVVSPSNPRIPGSFDTNKNSFVMMSDFSKIITGLKGHLAEAKFKQLAIVRFDSAFGEEIGRNLNNMVVEMGKPAVITETYKEIGNNDFRTVILKLKQAGADLVFLDMIMLDPATFLTQAKQLGYNPQVLTHQGARDTLAMNGVDKKLFEGVTVLNWDVVTDAFRQKFEVEYKVKPVNSANLAYDAVYILADAVANKGTTSIAEYLTPKTFSTPNGDFKFTSDHAAANTPVQIQVIRDGVLGVQASN